MAGDNSSVIMSGKDLRYLGELIYRKEVEVIKSQPFKSSMERNQYLHDCKVTYEALLEILKDVEEVCVKYKKDGSEDGSKGKIAHQMFCFVEMAVNTSLQFVKNYRVRATFLNKLKHHKDYLIAELHQLNSKIATDVEKLAAKVAKCNEVMIKLLENYKNPVSAAYSKWASRMTFKQIVKRYQSMLGYKRSFESLADAEKMEVYNEIIRASGRGNIFKMDKKEVGASAILLLVAAIMVWDIFTAEHKIETAFRDAGDMATTIVSGMLGGVVTFAIKDSIQGATYFAIRGATYFATGVGFLAGFAAGVLIGEFVDSILDLIFNSGGSAPLKTQELKLYVALAPMPDGAVLALQISHHY